MKNKAIEMIVQKETDLKSKTADGYSKKRTIEMHGGYDVLTVKVIISGDPKAIDKAMKSLNVKTTTNDSLDKKASVVLSEYVNPQTTLDEQLDLAATEEELTEEE